MYRTADYRHESIHCRAHRQSNPATQHKRREAAIGVGVQVQQEEFTRAQDEKGYRTGSQLIDDEVGNQQTCTTCATAVQLGNGIFSSSVMQDAHEATRTHGYKREGDSCYRWRNV